MSCACGQWNDERINDNNDGACSWFFICLLYLELTAELCLLRFVPSQFMVFVHTDHHFCAVVESYHKECATNIWCRFWMHLGHDKQSEIFSDILLSMTVEKCSACDVWKTDGVRATNVYSWELNVNVNLMYGVIYRVWPSVSAAGLFTEWRKFRTNFLLK